MTKILLSTLGAGLLLGPLAGMAMGPATMKAPPQPSWRASAQPAIQGGVSSDFAASGPEDRSPPQWVDDYSGPRPSALRMAADGTRYAEPRYAAWRDEESVGEPSEPEPVAIDLPAAEHGVTVHRGATDDSADAPADAVATL